MILLEAANTAFETYTIGGAIFAGLGTGSLAIASVIKRFLAKYLKLQDLADLRVEKLIDVVELLVTELQRDRSTRAISKPDN